MDLDAVAVMSAIDIFDELVSSLTVTKTKVTCLYDRTDTVQLRT